MQPLPSKIIRTVDLGRDILVLTKAHEKLLNCMSPWSSFNNTDYIKG